MAERSDHQEQDLRFSLAAYQSSLNGDTNKIQDVSSRHIWGLILSLKEGFSYALLRQILAPLANKALKGGGRPD
jgi:hypothetical protein